MDTNGSLPQFSLFPLEIRRLIWKSCLPRRIAEEDFPYTLLDGKEGRQACWPVRSVLQNARVPLLATVCAESREVVFEWGGHQVSQDETSLKSIWLQPKIDRAIHVNWTRRRNEEYELAHDANPPQFDNRAIDIALTRAVYFYHTRISMVGELFYPFDLAPLMDPGLPPSSERLSAFRASTPLEIPSMPLGDHPPDTELVESRSRDYHTIIGCVWSISQTLLYYNVDFPVRDTRIYTTVVAISIHVQRAAALSSGLFGLQGDAPVQTVDYNDLPQLRRFSELFMSNSELRQAEPHAEDLFNLVLSPVLHAAVILWKKKVTWLMQVAVWKYLNLGEGIKTFEGMDPGLVWTPPVVKNETHMRMDRYLPNEDHPWWKDHAEKYMVEVVPQIMLRLCDNQCYREQRRPALFGEVSFSSFTVHNREKGVGRIVKWGDFARGFKYT